MDSAISSSDVVGSGGLVVGRLPVVFHEREGAVGTRVHLDGKGTAWELTHVLHYWACVHTRQAHTTLYIYIYI